MATHTLGFVEEMKERLLAERELLHKELGILAQPSADEGYVARMPDYGRSEEDNATEVADYVASVAVTKVNKQRLVVVEAALDRIEAGKYGVTNDGQLIPEARLKANPAATTLI
jgi:RNA polymerase-binding transcription factor DksA